MRGDVITKIEDYDARDIRHADAQMLFKNAGNDIRLVVHRDNKLAVTKNITSNGLEPLPCSTTALPPYSPNINLLSPNYDTPHRLLLLVVILIQGMILICLILNKQRAIPIACVRFISSGHGETSGFFATHNVSSFKRFRWIHSAPKM